MKAFWKLTWTELKLFVREPIGLFFTLLFPLLLLVIFGSIFGNDPTSMFGGFGSVDNSVPGYMGMIIGTLGMVGLPISLATYREKGILRRFRATPLNPNVVLWSQVAVNGIMQLVGIGLLVVAARLLYDLRIPAAPLALLPAVLLGGLSFFSVGFVLAGVLPTARTAQAVGMALFYPMLFLSGAALPRQMLPETVRQVAEFLPLTHVVMLFEDLWFKGSWNLTALAVVTGILLVSLAVSSRTFRWE
jgi:ABC-2 type transport system permease protein